MCLASFGPIFIVPALPVMYFVTRYYIFNKNITAVCNDNGTRSRILMNSKLNNLAKFCQILNFVCMVQPGPGVACVISRLRHQISAPGIWRRSNSANGCN
jgi:hypothetical protein